MTRASSRAVRTSRGYAWHVAELEGDEGASRGTVLTVHGFASNSVMNWDRSGWTSVLVADGYRVVMPDLLGHGQSSKPHEPGAYAFNLMQQDLIDLLDELHVGPVHVLGYSFGARLGWALAASVPERVMTLSLGGMPATEPLRRFDVDGARRLLRGEDGPLDAFTASFLNAARSLPGSDPDAIIAFAEGLQMSSAAAASSQPQQPVLLVTGERDDVAPDTRELLLRAPHARFAEVAGRTHANLTSAREFKRLVLEHLSEFPVSGEGK